MATTDFKTLAYKAASATPQVFVECLARINATLRGAGAAPANAVPAGAAVASRYAMLREFSLGGAPIDFPRFRIVLELQADNWDIFDLSTEDERALVGALEELRGLAPEADLRSCIAGYEQLSHADFARERTGMSAENVVSTCLGPATGRDDQARGTDSVAKRQLIDNIRAAAGGCARVEIRTEVQR